MDEIIFWSLLFITLVCNIVALYLIHSGHHKLKRPRDDGFSIAEVMVAAGLVGQYRTYESPCRSLC